MPQTFFRIPVRDPGPFQDEFNSFVAARRVVTVERRFVEDGQDSFWCLCVDWTHSPAQGRGEAGSEKRIDYKEVLSPEQFEVFARLREVRKRIAEHEAVPPYAVFTNSQLAAMVQGAVNSKAAMGAIEGVGEAKVGKYGEAFLEALRAATPSPPAPP